MGGVGFRRNMLLLGSASLFQTLLTLFPGGAAARGRAERTSAAVHGPQVGASEKLWTLQTSRNSGGGRLIPGQEALNVHVHRPHIPGFVLLHPQLPVFGGIHVLQELVDGLHRLRRNRHQREPKGGLERPSEKC